MYQDIFTANFYNNSNLLTFSFPLKMHFYIILYSKWTSNDKMSKRHQSNASSMQSGILSNASSKNGIDFKSRNQSNSLWVYSPKCFKTKFSCANFFNFYNDNNPAWIASRAQSPDLNYKPMPSIVSENSKEELNQEWESQTYEKVEVEHSKKVSDSLDKLFATKTSDDRKSKKILMIGEKRITSEFSDSRSREREVFKKNKNTLHIKNKESNDKNSARKSKGTNINKELARKYADKLESGKVN